MTGSQKRKGDAAEREAAALLRDELGFPARRQLGAGRADDVGDLVGIPRTIVQVAAWSNVASAMRSKPVDAEQQRENADADFAVTLLRLRGGEWRAVLTVAQLCDLLREALA